MDRPNERPDHDGRDDEEEEPTTHHHHRKVWCPSFFHTYRSGQATVIIIRRMRETGSAGSNHSQSFMSQSYLRFGKLHMVFPLLWKNVSVLIDRANNAGFSVLLSSAWGEQCLFFISRFISFRALARMWTSASSLLARRSFSLSSFISLVQHHASHCRVSFRSQQWQCRRLHH